MQWTALWIWGEHPSCIPHACTDIRCRFNGYDKVDLFHCMSGMADQERFGFGDADRGLRPSAARREVNAPRALPPSTALICNEREGNMNNQFDELTKGLAQSVTRRGTLQKSCKV